MCSKNDPNNEILMKDNVKGDCEGNIEGWRLEYVKANKKSWAKDDKSQQDDLMDVLKI